jgi:16S rRNA (adenine1518-N6/adenine1519-N6)-dimethyltransferase
MKTKSLLKKHNINPNPMKDQFFLDNQKTIEKLVSLANLNNQDIVLEIGAGTGNLTRELAKFAGKVITFEIDDRFIPILESLPSNVDLLVEDAWDSVQLQGKFRKKKEYNKIVASPPYAFLEPFLHNLTFLIYDKVVLLVPMKFVESIKENAVFSSFFQPEIKFKVDKKAFYPQPSITSAAIILHQLPDPLGAKNPGLFLRQYIYQHEQQLVKNSLREGLIVYYQKVNNKKVTKNQARQMVDQSDIPKKYLDQTPNSFQIYHLVESNFKSK